MRKEFFRYAFVGSSAFTVEFLSFCLLYYVIHFAATPANAISFLVGLMTSFLLNRVWTFAHERGYRKHMSHQLVLYGLVATVNLLLTVLLLKIFQHSGFDIRISKLATMILTSGWNYLIFKLVIFKHNRANRLEVA